MNDSASDGSLSIGQGEPQTAGSANYKPIACPVRGRRFGSWPMSVARLCTAHNVPEMHCIPPLKTWQAATKVPETKTEQAAVSVPRLRMIGGRGPHVALWRPVWMAAPRYRRDSAFRVRACPPRPVNGASPRVSTCRCLRTSSAEDRRRHGLAH